MRTLSDEPLIPIDWLKRKYSLSKDIEEYKEEKIEFKKEFSPVKTRKNYKKKYPKEFVEKRRFLLDIARNNNWCTACWFDELLQVHHIDKNKFNNDDDNLIVLCYYCHSKEHKHMQRKTPPKWLK